MRAVRFDLPWRYWLATALLLTVGLVGSPLAMQAAIVVVAAQVVHFAGRAGGRATLALQVRVLFFALTLAGLWPPLGFAHVAIATGAWANVLTGYCMAARMLSLAPWNRRVPLTARLVAWTFLSPPAPGSILERVPHSPPPRSFGAGQDAAAQPAHRR